ncbi:MAG: 16S rRNA (guanine(527)-N(7))-methyltransferase RsmG [Thermodesulfobacteriota bacterium]|nr:16S rRNA (guanine(527)-N(7))-methyltransferase RsmG [Thermodesulfobacteriota bacterium]
MNDPHAMPMASEAWQQLIRQGARDMGLYLTDPQLRMFAAHATELYRWNKKINLTAISEPASAAVKHFLDAIAPAGLIPDRGHLLDIGTGGGFPGIPLKIVKPGLSVTLVDAAAKKINFTRQVIRLLGLTGITAHHCRLTPSERPPYFIAGFDTVICRAFTSISNFVCTAADFIPEAGRLIAMKGGDCAEELTDLQRLELQAPDGRMTPAAELFTVDVQPYRLYHLKNERTLVVLTKQATASIRNKSEYQIFQ